MLEPELDLTTLGDVSDTGLLTAFCHAIESRSRDPLLRDPVGEAVADRLRPLLAASPKPLLRKLAAGKIRRDLVYYIALRARQYDRYARDFVARHPEGGVVNLGCGLDTRFWRIDDGRLHCHDLDLPEMIALKQRLVPEDPRYHLIGSSVLDHAWMDRLAAESPGPFIFLAEGLFMYLPGEGVRALVTALAERFAGSELVVETFNARWLGPATRWIIVLKMRKQVGIGSEALFRSGIRDGHEPESWHPGVHLLDEWYYMDVDEPKLGFSRHFLRLPVFRRIQWTVHYRLGP